MTYKERVARGAALLDKEYPQWHKQINIDILDIGACSRCILGQLYKHFELGRHVFSEAERTPEIIRPSAVCGFDWDENEIKNEATRWLNIRWKQLIRERLIDEHNS